MTSFQPYQDIPAIYEDDRTQHQPLVLQSMSSPSEYSWDAYEIAMPYQSSQYRLPPKRFVDSQYEVLNMRSDFMRPDQFQSYCNPDTFHLAGQNAEWDPAIDNFRHLRYHSPNGHFGGTLSESSSEYAMSPEASRTSCVFNSGPVAKPFNFAPAPLESQLVRQRVWSASPVYMDAFSSCSIDGTLDTQAIAMKELEFQSSMDCQLEMSFHDEDDTIQVNARQLPMQAPEELELSESIATLTTASRSNTFSSPASEEEDETSLREEDRDSDPDFNPHRATASRSSRSAHARSRSATLPRSPRHSSAYQSHPVLAPSSRIHKPARRLQDNREKINHKTLLQTAGPKSKSLDNSSGKTVRSFPCTFHAFGCLSTFGNKNEWKRHVSSQHLQLGFFRCDLGGCNPHNSVQSGNRSTGERKHKRKGSNNLTSSGMDETELTFNDFNRKDLFTQHCRRMHGPLRHATDNTTRTNQQINERVNRKASSAGAATKTKNVKHTITKDDEAAFEVELDEIRQRCWRVRRKAPSRSSCGVCGKVFEVENSPINRRNSHKGQSHQLSEDSSDSDMDTLGEDDDGKAEEHAWEERMEHIGKHYERDNATTEVEGMDDDLLEWGLDVGVLENVIDARGKAKPWLIGYEITLNNSYNSTKVEEEEDDQTIDPDLRSSRRTGLRRRSAATIVGRRYRLAIKEEEDSTDEEEEIVRKRQKSYDSDEDALGEYE